MSRQRVRAMLAGAAVATAAVVGVATTVPTPVVSPAVDLSAVIVGASSTNPSGGGVANFYGGLFRQGQESTVVADFFSGAHGIYHAIAGSLDDATNVVLSSGWGAANTSLLLTYLAATGRDSPVLTNPALYVLDNNVASPNGGFGTRLPIFALLGVNPLPTPTAPGVPVVNVVYEYDINSNIPAYLWNAPAMLNSLMAYFERRLNQESLDFPLDADGTVRADLCDADCRTDLDAGVTRTFTLANGETVRVKLVDNTTYVSYESQRLPLVAPLRLLGPVGDRLADALTPVLRAIVDFGYPNNDPLAAPERYIPARLLPRPHEVQRFVDDFRGGVRQGLENLRGAPEPVDGPSSSARSSARADTETESPREASTHRSTKTSDRQRTTARVRESTDSRPQQERRAGTTADKDRGDRDRTDRGAETGKRSTRAS